MDVIGYIRVSSDEQAQGGHSLGLIQPSQIAHWCEQNGHVLVDIVEDAEVIQSGKNRGKLRGVSAGKPFAKRKGGRFILERLKAGVAQGIVIAKVDRAFRDAKDALDIGFDLKRNGFHLFTTEEYTDIHDNDGWLMFGIKALLAENERSKTCARNKDITTGLRDDALAYGPVPYGCIRVDVPMSEGGSVIKRLFHDPVEWPVREYIVKRHDLLKNFRALARELKADGIPAPQGGNLWHVNTLKNIIETHHTLEHYPLLPDSPETVVS